MRGLVVSTLATSLGLAALLAAQSVPVEEPWRVNDGPDVSRDARLASVLSVTTPVALLAATYGANWALGTPYLAQQTHYYAIPGEVDMALVAGAPLGFAAGYFYAGEPLRGSLVGLGGCAIGAAGFTYLVSLSDTQQNLSQGPVVLGLMLAATIGYGWWVAQDVYGVAARRRGNERQPKPEP